MTIGALIKQFREENDISQREMAIRSGVSNYAISMYEKDGINPKTGKPFKLTYETYFKLANVMGMTIDELFEKLGNDAIIDLLPSNIYRVKNMHQKRVPLIGKVAAGEPILAQEEYDLLVPAPANADYALEIAGESMMPTYLPGDVIYIREQPDIDHQGQVAVVLLDDEATVKHVYKQKDGLMLISDNPAYEPMFKRYADFDTIRILGKVCGYTRMYK